MTEYTITDEVAQLPYMEFWGVIVKARPQLTQVERDWLGAWNRVHLSITAHTTEEWRLLRYSHYLGWFGCLTAQAGQCPNKCTVCDMTPCPYKSRKPIPYSTKELRTHNMYGHRITPVGGGFGISVSVGITNDGKAHPDATLYHESDGFRQCLMTVTEEGPVNVFHDRYKEVMGHAFHIEDH